MLSTEFEYLYTELECFLQGWNAFDRVGTPSTGLECFLQGWHAFHRAGGPLYRNEIVSTGLAWFPQSWRHFVQG
jgi:hypothetical protein